ncbi:unnamed protein product, partial [Aphanomyces euteiches]
SPSSHQDPQAVRGQVARRHRCPHQLELDLRDQRMGCHFDQGPHPGNKGEGIVVGGIDTGVL